MKAAIIFLVMTVNTIAQASSRYVSYEDVREEGGFASEAMLMDRYVVASDKTPLTDNEKESMLSSDKLGNLRGLDLSGQNIDDEFVKRLAGNPSLSRLMTLNLSNNPEITDASLEHIRGSTVFGSVRDLPQVSARYGGPATTITIKCKGTAITKREIDPVFYFHIEYKHPAFGTRTTEPTDMGIKFVEIEK